MQVCQPSPVLKPFQENTLDAVTMFLTASTNNQCSSSVQHWFLWILSFELHVGVWKYMFVSDYTSLTVLSMFFGLFCWWLIGREGQHETGYFSSNDTEDWFVQSQTAVHDRSHNLIGWLLCSFQEWSALSVHQNGTNVSTFVPLHEVNKTIKCSISLAVLNSSPRALLTSLTHLIHSDNQLVRSALRAWTVFRLTCSLHSVHCSLLPGIENRCVGPFVIQTVIETTKHQPDVWHQVMRGKCLCEALTCR